MAVHGIGVDPQKTWEYKASNGAVNWLCNERMLPARLPRARIMTFGYDSAWYGPNAIRQNLDGLGKKLLKDLEMEREVRTLPRLVLDKIR